ncbi:glycosyltransferase involved in cell wall biosynthesis [Bradyrhizobium sp. GM2.4]
MVYNIALAVAARGCGYSIFLHHHSFNYIDRPRGLMRLLIAAGGSPLTHVFLCKKMRDHFTSAYKISSNTRVVSNAAFVEAEASSVRLTGPLTIGLLSNLTKEKGLHTFLRLLQALRAEGFTANGILAGPIANDEDRKLVDGVCDDLSGMLQYRGPLYGSPKHQFYREIDVFVFPTEYAHEAEPTVLFEALAAGALVIAFDRGCITSQITENGLIVPTTANFVQHSLKYIEKVTADITGLRAGRSSRIDAYHRVHTLSFASAKRLLKHAPPT